METAGAVGRSAFCPLPFRLFVLPLLAFGLGSLASWAAIREKSSAEIASEVKERRAPRLIPPTTTLAGEEWRMDASDERLVLVHAWSSKDDDSLGSLVRLRFLKESLGEDAPIRFLGVVMDTPEDAAKRVIERLGLDWPQVHEQGKPFKGEMAGAFQLTKFGRANLVQPDGGVLHANMRESRMMDRVQSQAKKMSILGKSAPGIETTDLAGEPWSLAEQRGKVVVVDFWATWYGPCKKEVPNLKKLHERHGTREDFLMVGISLDDEAEDLRSYIETAALPWPTLFEPGKAFRNSAAKAYGVISIPTLVVIGRDGKVVLVGLKGDPLAESVQAALDS